MFKIFTNPSRFMGFSGRALPWLMVVTTLVMIYGLYKAFYVAPADYQQGETVRIMFVHVPSAWLAMGAYTLIAIAAIGTLVWRHTMADVSARAAAPLGAGFTAIALITGSLWGRPMWGTWWVWDARLTSVLLLFLMYIGLIVLRRAFDDPSRGARAAAVLALVGFINIPIIKFSVDWWNTLHQPASVLRFDGPTIHPTILWPLLVMAIAFALLFVTLHMMAMRNEILRHRVRAMQIRASRDTGAASSDAVAVG